MGSNVRHGLRRRGRSVGAKRRTARAAIPVGALAAASIPLWPSPASAFYELPPPDQQKDESRTVTVVPYPIGPVHCTIRGWGIRHFDSATVGTEVTSEQPECRTSSIHVRLTYVTLAGETRTVGAHAEGPSAEVQFDAANVRRITETDHYVYWVDGCQYCDHGFALNYSSK